MVSSVWTASSARFAVGASSRRFAAWLAGIVAVAVGIRAYYTLRIAPWPPPYDDELVFRGEALTFLSGPGFNDFNESFRGLSLPGASHPPLYPFVLALLAKLGGTGQEAQRLTGSVFGAATIVLVGVLGRRLANDRVGLLAAGIAAAYPTFVAADGALMSESLFGTLVAASLVAAYRSLDRPADGRAVVLGVLVGLAALTRGEALLLVPLLLVPIVRQPRGRRAALITCLATVLVITPWSVRNWIAFHRPVLISTNLYSAIAGANCHSTYYDYAHDYIGGWNNSCIRNYPGDEATRWGRARDDAIRYAAHHVGRLPVVGAHRLMRVWGLEHTELPTPLGGSLPHLEGRSPDVSEAGFWIYDALVPLAIYGYVLLRRRAVATWILMSTFVLVTVNALFIYGNVRFRQPAEISLVVLAAVAVDELWRRIGRRLETRAPAASSAG